RGHLALASFYRAGKAPAVITQNIDNLHQSSGISAEHVIELHGNNSYALCLTCGKRYELSWVRRQFTDARDRAPDCTDCGGHIKKGTASLGQRMRRRGKPRAGNRYPHSDFFLAGGL